MYAFTLFMSKLLITVYTPTTFTLFWEMSRTTPENEADGAQTISQQTECENNDLKCHK